MSDLGKFGISKNIAMCTFQRNKSCSFLISSHENKGCQSDFLVGSPFSDVDFGQLEDALDEPRQSASR
jgi:hypothetical protein